MPSHWRKQISAAQSHAIRLAVLEACEVIDGNIGGRGRGAGTGAIEHLNQIAPGVQVLGTVVEVARQDIGDEDVRGGQTGS